MKEKKRIDTYFATGYFPDGSEYHESSNDRDYLISKENDFKDWNLFVRHEDGTEEFQFGSWIVGRF